MPGWRRRPGKWNKLNGGRPVTGGVGKKLPRAGTQGGEVEAEAKTPVLSVARATTIHWERPKNEVQTVHGGNFSIKCCQKNKNAVQPMP